MAGATGRLIALLFASAPLGVIGAIHSDTISGLAGAYREPGGWMQIIPVGTRHAYVHLYFEGGIGGDLMSEFENVMNVRGPLLTFREPATADGPGCSFKVRRVRDNIVWSAPHEAPCTRYANRHYPGIFQRGTMKTASRRAAIASRRYPGEGYGYATTVAEWRKKAVP